MTTTTVTPAAPAVKTVDELYAAWRAATAAVTVAFTAMVHANYSPESSEAYLIALQSMLATFQAWHAAAADEEARDAYTCAQHDLACDLEYPRSYEDPIPYAITSAGARYLDRRNQTRSETDGTFSDDLPF